MTEDQKILYVIGIGFLLIIYTPPTVIAYRNTKFRLPVRVLFSFSVVPLFMALMAVNYWLVAKYAPALLDLWQSIPENRQARKPASIIAVLITCPVSVAGCYVWFQVLKFIDVRLLGNRMKRPEAVQPDR
jgi:hypothetical protein